MPTLDWIGKKAVVGHHNEVPFRLLKSNDGLSVGDVGSGNLLVQGDNLTALKALLPYYAQQVKCIYIDPPYNTGNESWVYNDNVSSPEIREWLGKVVGAESEDLSRHDKWLCMMYPRLCLLKDFLRQDGAIFISIDDNEFQNLRQIMDEVFGPRNFVATVLWQKVYAPKNSAKHFSEDHDYIVVYARDAEIWRPNLLSRTLKQDKAYKNMDNDTRGLWRADGMSARNYYSKGTYEVAGPNGRKHYPPRGRYWIVSEDNFKALDRDHRIWWGADGNNAPALKRFLSEVKQGVVPQTLWLYSEVGHTQEAKQELVAAMDFEDSPSVFITPKPLRLIRRILEIGADRDSIILDSFAGSGTTGIAALAANKEDGGDRRFILVEMDEGICRSITAERLRRVINGYTAKRTGGKTEEIPPLGGGFRYCKLGTELFDANGQIGSDVTFEDLARHVFFAETGEPLSQEARDHSPMVGVANGVAIYLLYNGILGDRSPEGGNVLTPDLLRKLPKHDGPRVVYGEACLISDERLRRLAVVFRQIPYEVKVS